MKKVIAAVLPILLLFALIAGTTINAYAFQVVASHVIDNDDAQGYSNRRSGFDTRIQASNLYYQDARKQSCNSVENYYEYILQDAYASRKTIQTEVSAYLYNTAFTDPQAKYVCRGTYSWSDFSLSVDYINQDLAAPGWNVIGTGQIFEGHSDGINYLTSVVLYPSSTNSTKYCGADAIMISYGNN